ncbi:MAG: TonB-dependent receptor plug domain-containing protein [Myxococcota bacterium]
MIWALVSIAAAAPLEGVVRRRGSGDPIPAAEIRLGGDVLGRSGPDGRFVAEVPEQGSARLVIFAAGYRPAEAVVTLPTDASVAVYLEPAAAEPEIVIEARRSSPHAVRRVLDRERVEETPGTFVDPLRLIQTLPGAVVTPEYSPTAGEVVLRGSGPGESRIYFDGVELPYLYHFQQYASIVHPRLLDEVAVYPSAFSAAYGDATGGVVAVKTREAETDRPHGSAEINLITVGGALTSPAGEAGAVSLSGRRSFADLRESSNDQYTFWPVFWDYLARYDRVLEPGHRISITGLGAGDTYGRFAGDAASLDPLEQASNPDFDFSRRFHSLFLRDDLTGGWGRAQTVLAYVDDRWSGELDAARQLREERYAWLRQSTVLLPRDWLQLHVGIESKLAWVSREVETERAWVELAAEAPLLNRGVSQDEDVQRLTGGLWVEPHWLLGTTRVQTGVRTQWDTASSSLVVDPRLTVQSEVGVDWQIRAAAGRYSQPPPLDALSQTAGDPTLTPARSEHVALGVDREILERLELAVDGWAKQLRDIVVADPGEAPKLEDGWAAGVEVTTRYRIRERFFSSISASLGRARRADRPFAYDQPYALNAIASWDVSPKWNLGVRYRYAAGLPFTRIEGGVYNGDTDAYEPVFGGVNGARLGDYQKIDGVVRRTQAFRRWTLTLYAEGWYVPPQGNALYPVYNYDFSEQALVAGPVFVPLVGGRIDF